MNNVIMFDREKFSKLVSVMNIMSNNCDNLVVKNGLIRQYTNKGDYLYNIDMREIIGENDLVLTNIKNKVALFSPFIKQKVESVRMEIKEESENFTRYIFSDDFTRISIPKPNENFLGRNDKFVTDEDFTDIFKIVDNNPIFDVTINKMMIDRLLAYSKTMTSKRIDIVFENRKVNFYLKVLVGNNRSNITVVDMFNFDLNTEINGEFSIFSETLLISPESLNIVAYKGKSNDMNESIILNFKTENLIEGLDFKLWTIGTIRKDNDTDSEFIFDSDNLEDDENDNEVFTDMQ